MEASTGECNVRVLSSGTVRVGTKQGCPRCQVVKWGLLPLFEFCGGYAFYFSHYGPLIKAEF